MSARALVGLARKAARGFYHEGWHEHLAFSGRMLLVSASGLFGIEATWSEPTPLSAPLHAQTMASEAALVRALLASAVRVECLGDDVDEEISSYRVTIAGAAEVREAHDYDEAFSSALDGLLAAHEGC